MSTKTNYFTAVFSHHCIVLNSNFKCYFLLLCSGDKTKIPFSHFISLFFIEIINATRLDATMQKGIQPRCYHMLNMYQPFYKPGLHNTRKKKAFSTERREEMFSLYREDHEYQNNSAPIGRLTEHGTKERRQKTRHRSPDGQQNHKKVYINSKKTLSRSQRRPETLAYL